MNVRFFVNGKIGLFRVIREVRFVFVGQLLSFSNVSGRAAIQRGYAQEVIFVSSYVCGGVSFLVLDRIRLCQRRRFLPPQYSLLVRTFYIVIGSVSYASCSGAVRSRYINRVPIRLARRLRNVSGLCQFVERSMVLTWDLRCPTIGTNCNYDSRIGQGAVAALVARDLSSSVS